MPTHKILMSPVTLIGDIQIGWQEQFSLTLECRNGPSKAEGPFLYPMDG
jgi:hypothetical protein